ncbi:MAG: toll/interleukin-1 receptor domain-containing protein [Pyrinomonadaceae bacterium]
MSTSAVFISYSHKDEKWKDRLVTQLEVLRQEFEVWTDRDIQAGEFWYQKIEEALQKAKVAIFLVSANSLTSPFILKEEVVRLLERRDKEGLRIMPIIVAPCAWQRVEWLARMQVRPRDGRPLQNMSAGKRDTALMEVVQEVAALLAKSTTTN